MKQKLVLMVTSLCAFILVGCASTMSSIDSRYEFSEFDRVDRITNYRLRNWQDIDSQSVLIETTSRDHYLIVLKRPLPDLRFAQTIGFTSTADSVRAKLDLLKVGGPGHATLREAVIYSIYRLNGEEDIEIVRAQIEVES